MLSTVAASEVRPNREEFNIPGIVVEGLALAAVHEDESKVLLTPTFFQRCLYDITSHTRPPSIEALVESIEIINLLVSHLLLDNFKPAPPKPQETGVHTLSVLARVSKDQRFDEFRQTDLSEVYEDVKEKFGTLIREYACQWSLDMHLDATEWNKMELENKLEELAWAYTAFYLSGWTEGQTLDADFVTLHVVPSSLFLFSLAPKLKVSSQILLLRSHFAVSLAWWIGRGQAQIVMPSFAQAKDKTNTSDPWLSIFKSAIVRSDEHVAQVQRALAHYAQMYGLKRPSDARLSATELPGADELDGSLFLRIAKLTAERTEQRPEDADERPAYD